ncbi:stemmadenine O-acetyltransferase-like [Cornus florida]|uniref:stemmadenine O-acetyltransferase-like n=1 Tax=Cornus florida TaxID=4283 RepID=UPI0028968D94|nr:stemmadenine O-acetyltransferase-like [Cornus florida]
MMMNIEVLSRETIKPSSPTPQHLRNLRLSLLDQLSVRFYVPIIFFYDHMRIILKKSLGECLSRYYPLAGTIRDDISVDCNDAGAEYIEARVGCKLSEAIKKSDFELLKPLLPFDPYGNVIGRREALVGVKFNVFDCGGVGIGMCVSHRIADAASVSAFVNAWATMSRGGGSSTEADDPIFDAALLFPPIDIVPAGFKLEKRASSSSCVGVLNKYSPTCVQVVSALIWNTFMTTIRSKPKPGNECVAVHAVNLRDKMVPPLPNHFFGNLLQIGVAATTVDGDKDLGALASLIGNGVREINDEYVRRLKMEDDHVDSSKKERDRFLKGEKEVFASSSWCRFPRYEVDFGWGKPVGKRVGIEAWVNLSEQDMAILQHDLDLLSFVSSVY